MTTMLSEVDMKKIPNEVKMRVKATKVENGFLIPFIDKFKEIKQNMILLDVEFIDLEKERAAQKKVKGWPDRFFEEVVGEWAGGLERPDQGDYEVREDF